ncbi:cobalt-precorrin-6A reductase [Rubellimicrobium aerolatum]|uniref:Cobalt-precorrin-6A reductase n=1 Tax=Rubellimicrobium aerolatum TaxID=490979 RepID=A0ABW0S7S2_9RHOB|nr:precorrin-6A/cobalt-precorrin-6A reductase [Rubellimicrobium aerolatum]
MILLLAGTSDARRLAQRLAAERIPALASLAGATREPAPLPLPTRHGGFGGPEAFATYLDRETITAVIDATHPFAARISARTHAICAAKGLPHLRLERPGWPPEPGWTTVTDESEAIRLIPATATVFLATGRQSLPAWTGLRARKVHLRSIDPPEGPFPFPGGPILARPPFDRAAETALFRDLGVTHLVAKDSGAADARPKLDAARDLGLAVLILRRPPAPPGLVPVFTVEEALAWAKVLPFRSSGPTSGP